MNDALTVRTKAGDVKGIWLDATGAEAGRLRCWRGIPYAKVRRFEAPQPVAPWEGVRGATDFALQCPQIFGSIYREAQVSSADYGEECLALNIWAPEGASPDEPRPVLVFIHGGAFIVGSSNMYDGSEMAHSGDMIVVTINYRVGVLGFLNFGEALGLPQFPSNLGLRDQIAALSWVRDNIAAFGGDPNRVTIMGQSAGSMSVSLLMLSDAARGLYHGAIMQSGALSLIHDHAKSVDLARKYADRLGVNQGDAERLQTMDLKSLFEVQAAISDMMTADIPAAPWYDGDLLPGSLAQAQAKQAPHVPLLAGAAREESRLFEWMPGDMLPTKRPMVEKMLRAQLPANHAERIIAAYPRTRKGDRALASDLTFFLPTRHFAERHSAHAPTWFYRFDCAHPLVGATHGIDLTYVWPITGPRAALIRGGPRAGVRLMLSERMVGHIAAFVRDGVPAPDWPPYTAADPKVRVYNFRDEIITNPEADRYAAWAGADVAPSLPAET